MRGGEIEKKKTMGISFKFPAFLTKGKKNNIAKKMKTKR